MTGHRSLGRLPLGLSAMLAATTLSSAMACDWTYYLNVEGHQVESEIDNPASYVARLTRKAGNRKGWEKVLTEAEEKWRSTNDFKWQSDYAVCLMHLGNPDRAIQILEAIEQEHPGEYAIAANLGTAHELSGDNEKALEWILEGIRRNANAHNGSEWLHAKILQAKLELAGDPSWLRTHSVSGIEFGAQSQPDRPSEPLDLGIGRALSLKEVQKAIEYQLGERLGFVSAPDAIVADLIFDLGNITAFTKGVQIAAPVYDQSLKFAPARERLVRERRIAGWIDWSCR